MRVAEQAQMEHLGESQAFRQDRQQMSSMRENSSSRYKVPSTIEFIGSLPKSAVGKVLRRELKEAEDAKQ